MDVSQILFVVLTVLKNDLNSTAPETVSITLGSTQNTLQTVFNETLLPDKNIDIRFCKKPWKMLSESVF